MSMVVEGQRSSATTVSRRRGLFWLACLAAVVILIALPGVLDQKGMHYAIRLLIAALYAMGFNVLWSQARLLSFGQAAPFGIGAFCVLHLMRVLEDASFTFPTPLLPVVGILAGIVVGVFVGFFATIRTGTYFSMITLAMTELLSVLARRWNSVFGGETGLSSMRMPWAGISFGNFYEVYYVVLFWCLVGLAALWYLTLTPFGNIAAAVGNNERRLAFLGFNTRLLKTQIVTVSFAVAGLAGGLLSFTTENASYELFSGYTSAEPIIQSFLGGVGTFLGPALGAAVLSLFGLVLSDVTRIWLLYQGILFILVIILLPIGIGGAIAALCSGRTPWARMGPWLAMVAAGTLLSSIGVVLLSELSYRFFQVSNSGEALLRILGISIPATSIPAWVLGLVAACIGLKLILKAERKIREAWISARPKS
jgi:branched-chain amino acid transport system permease protein